MRPGSHGAENKNVLAPTTAPVYFEAPGLSKFSHRASSRDGTPLSLFSILRPASRRVADRDRPAGVQEGRDEGHRRRPLSNFSAPAGVPGVVAPLRRFPSAPNKCVLVLCFSILTPIDEAKVIFGAIALLNSFVHASSATVMCVNASGYREDVP